MNDLWFEYKGINSREFGKKIHISRLPPIVKPAERIKSVTVPGRSGTLHFPEGGDNPVYESCIKPVTITVLDPDIYHDLRVWLSGSGPLRFSNEPDFVYTAICYEPYSNEYYMRRRGNITVNFDVQPLKYNRYSRAGGFNGNDTLLFLNSLQQRILYPGEIYESSLHLTDLIGPGTFRFRFGKPADSNKTVIRIGCQNQANRVQTTLSGSYGGTWANAAVPLSSLPPTGQKNTLYLRGYAMSSMYDNFLVVFNSEDGRYTSQIIAIGGSSDDSDWETYGNSLVFAGLHDNLKDEQIYSYMLIPYGVSQAAGALAIFTLQQHGIDIRQSSGGFVDFSLLGQWIKLEGWDNMDSTVFGSAPLPLGADMILDESESDNAEDALPYLAKAPFDADEILNGKVAVKLSDFEAYAPAVHRGICNGIESLGLNGFTQLGGNTEQIMSCYFDPIIPGMVYLQFNNALISEISGGDYSVANVLDKLKAWLDIESNNLHFEAQKDTYIELESPSGVTEGKIEVMLDAEGIRLTNLQTSALSFPEISKGEWFRFMPGETVIELTNKSVSATLTFAELSMQRWFV